MIVKKSRRVVGHMFGHGGRMVGQLKRRAASGAVNTSGGSDTPSEPEPGEEVLLPMMVPQQSDVNPQARGVLFDARPTITAPTERHWFVADDTGHYCRACNLPPANRRHVRKAA